MGEIKGRCDSSASWWWGGNNLGLIVFCVFMSVSLKGGQVS